MGVAQHSKHIHSAAMHFKAQDISSTENVFNNFTKKKKKSWCSSVFCPHPYHKSTSHTLLTTFLVTLTTISYCIPASSLCYMYVYMILCLHATYQNNLNPGIMVHFCIWSPTRALAQMTVLHHTAVLHISHMLSHYFFHATLTLTFTFSIIVNRWVSSQDALWNLWKQFTNDMKIEILTLSVSRESFMLTHVWLSWSDWLHASFLIFIDQVVLSELYRTDNFKRTVHTDVTQILSGFYHIWN